MDKKILTLAFPLREGEILLGYKKRGFGEGRWNGFGGKVHSDETIEEAAVRELREESDLSIECEDLEKVGLLNFHFPDGAHLEVHTFFIRTWHGEPVEGDEMRPQWFAFEHIPYGAMWPDDAHWLPRALRGEKIIGEAHFDETGSTILRMTWNAVPRLP